MNRIDRAARVLFDNWNLKAPYEALSIDLAIQTIQDAYAVQLALQGLHAENRGAIAGRKIALSSTAMQQMIGIDQPVAGAIFSGDIVLSPATIKTGDFIRLGLEFELAFELNCDLPPHTAAHTSETAYGSIAAVRPAFELIEDRNADYSNLDPYTLIADNAWCGGVVLGQELTNWRELDLGNIPSQVHQTGQPVEETNTGAADPLGSLAWVLNHFSDRGLSLSRGEFIITGSAVRTRFPIPGDHFGYDVAGSTVRIDVV